MIVRSSILPRYASVVLIIGALALLASNDQDGRVLFMVPFGLAWVIAGYALLQERERVTTST